VVGMEVGVVERRRVHRDPLILRLAWVATLTFILTLFIAGVPVAVQQVQTVCSGDSCGALETSPELAASLREHGVSPNLFAGYILALDVITLAAFCGVAALLYRRRLDEPIALLGAIMLVAFGGATFSGPITALGDDGVVWKWLVALAAFVGSASVFVFFYVFPDGRFVPRWTRWAAVGWVTWNLLGYFSPDDWPMHAEAGSGPIFPLVVMGFFGSVLVAQVWRYRRFSRSTERQQTKWVVFGFAAALSGIFLTVFLKPVLLGPSADPFASAMVGFTSYALSLLLIPLSIGGAILRYRLFEIDIIINRALLYGALTACVVGLYVLIVGYLGALVQGGHNQSQRTGGLLVSIVATGIVAVLFQPLRAWLQQGVNRLLYGERDDPYAVLSRLGERLEATMAPEAVLPMIVTTVQDALKLPWVGIALNEHGTFVPVAESGAPVEVALSIPLTYQHEVVGELRLAPRAPWPA
jgi:hypothetical protein